ncbi:phosphatase and actin regulator 2-like isoform X3 [Acipenser ruthenus]|uniref:phosphatase and actin regulator 2-like isoform X3 n=1 Tax=Acipenser ruthenus TaxID=7906 RepID=UPI002740570C|nr:phosphatase and actin regulator 2-like isoform X3 [Acipenser ruthenus]
MGQTSVSTLSQNASVDGLEKISLANSDVVIPGSQTPPLKRKGKLSSLGNIFKPWKWRKKKTSEKFQETSAVLERKISTRQSREELIRRGVLKEIPDQETSNGHTVPLSIEPVAEVDIEIQDDSSEGKKTSPTHETEDKKAKSSQPRKADSSKPVSQPSSSSPSTSSTSTARPKGSKNSSVGKKGNSGTPKVQKKPAKQPEHHKVPTTSSPKITPGPTSSRCPPEVTEAGDSVCKEPAESELPPSSLPSEQLAPEQPSPPELPANAPLDITAEEPPNGQAAVEENASVPSPSVSISDSSDQLQVEQVQDNGEEANGPQAEDKNISGENESCSSSDEVEESPGPAHQVLIRTSPEVTLIPNDESKEHQVSDSDSDGPVLYRDEEEDEDDEYTSSSLANKIHRKDTLTIKLGNRPSKKELEDKNILPRTSEEVKQEIRQQLVRRLSQRPTPEELEQRNILKQKNKEEEQEAKQELKRSLSRKLSLRPTVAELVARRILRFNEYVEVTDAKDYDRRADKPWTRLTPADKAAIRKELNEFKSTEMEVHEDSKQFTRFHRP